MRVENIGDLPCFPCRPDKRPLTRRGFYDAQRVEPPEEWPLVAMPTGTASGIDVVDVDTKGLAWFDAQHLPLTRLHETQSGGLHLLFRHARGIRNNAGRIAPGVDVRGDGGYIVYWPREGLPVCEAPIADWPEWLLEVIGRKRNEIRQHADEGEHGQGGIERTVNLRVRSRALLRALERMGEGERNNATYWTACRFGEMVGTGKIKREVAEHLLIEACKINGLWLGIWEGQVTDPKSERCKATIKSGLDRGIRAARMGSNDPRAALSQSAEGNQHD